MEKKVFSELPTTSLKSQVSDSIRNAILNGTFKPGERLIETSLANQFKISRIPVREALMQLQEQGLVMNQARRGMFVISLTETDVQRINSLRIVLEGEALKLCRANLTKSIENQLLAQIQQIEETSFDSDFSASSLDLEFHRTIWAGAGNPYLEKTLNSLLTVLFSHQTLAYANQHGQVHWPLHHHRPLLDVLLGTSTLSPEVAMINHLRSRYTNPERFSSLAMLPREP